MSLDSHSRVSFARADAGDADEHQGGKLRVDEVSVLVYKPSLHAVVDIHDHTAEVVEHLWVYRIHEELEQQRDVDARPEYLVGALKLLAFFHCHGQRQL